ncbi:protease I [Azospirillaceae bacterium]
MDDKPLAGNIVAIMVANGFEETEMTEPQRALLKAGATLKTISVEQRLVNGWHGKGWGHYFPVDKQISDVLGADFNMLLLPGGERSTTKLLQNPHTTRIVGHFLDAGKPIAAMDHGVELLAIARKLKGRMLTGAPAIRAKLEAAGAVWQEDQTMVVDGPLLTAQGLDALPGFVEQMLKGFAESITVKKAA